MDLVLKALAEPRRRKILSLIRRKEMSSGAIAAKFNVSRPAISQHLSVLLQAGLVTQRKRGTQRLYSVRPQAMGELRAYVQGFWNSTLNQLKFAAEWEEGEKKSDRRPN